MRKWLSRNQIRQRPGLMVSAGSLGIIAVAVVVFSSAWLSSRNDDHLAVIANFLSLGTLLLALVAGIIALAAYSAATGLPDLKVHVSLPLGAPNNIRLLATRTNDGIFAAYVDLNIASIVVQNNSKYAARTPAVVVRFQRSEIPVDRYTASPGWTPVDIRRHQNGAKTIRAVQWDGGPNYSIHGDSVRHLPDLNLQGLQPFAGPVVADMEIRLLADGYSYTPKHYFIMEFTFDDDPEPWPAGVLRWWV
jgi:hypothetical protein